uniref:Protein kinase domain-containing protein n=1 Tax=Guillardia theta TaxID=55529 RepID=A0A7S4KXI6_GUITH|mmetsp:Transcript_3284/g.11201  ORF Transcript_3284/g.11201 Transcript_3284/m.11201 type:complete len:755 (+) Transcript_3284:58-2322(+)
MGSGKSKPSNSVDKSSNNGKRSSAEYNRTPVKSNLVTARPSSTPAPINKATPSPAPIIKAVDEEAQLVENFRLAFKASPTDGWRKLVSGESVSVFVNNSGKLPFNMTCVRCEFKCPVPPEDVSRSLLDLDLRNERDFFFKEGKNVGSPTASKSSFQAVMKTLSSQEERPVLVARFVDIDDRGNVTIIEVPEGTFDLSGFTFPSFFVQGIGSDQSSVVALYRFDVKKVWKDLSDSMNESRLATQIHQRFSELAEPMNLFLLTLGAPKESQSPKIVNELSVPAPSVASTPPPAPKSSQPKSRRNSNSDSSSDTSGFSNSDASSKENTGDLIEGSKFRWKKGELIGHGAIGKVYMGLNFETGEMMAVKQVDLGEHFGPQAAEELKAMDQEIHIFSMISHPNLVRYYGMEKTSTQFFIFLEYVSGGSIATMLRKFGAFSEQMVSNFTAQIVDGLHYLHSQSICHRDIKAANILYSNDGVVKLADFGTAKKIADVMNMSTGLKSLVGTPYMMAPEVIRQTGHGPPADIWSLACVIWEMATTKHPFTQYTDRMVAMYNIAHAKAPPNPPETLSEVAKDFVRKCMIIEAPRRASTKQLLEHPFIANVERKTGNHVHDASPLVSRDNFVESAPRKIGSIKEEEERDLSGDLGTRLSKDQSWGNVRLDTTSPKSSDNSFDSPEISKAFPKHFVDSSRKDSSHRKKSDGQAASKRSSSSEDESEDEEGGGASEQLSEDGYTRQQCEVRPGPAQLLSHPCRPGAR